MTYAQYKPIWGNSLSTWRSKPASFCCADILFNFTIFALKQTRVRGVTPHKDNNRMIVQSIVKVRQSATAASLFILFRVQMIMYNARLMEQDSRSFTDLYLPGAFN